jgi:hypothetical protein
MISHLARQAFPDFPVCFTTQSPSTLGFAATVKIRRFVWPECDQSLPKPALPEFSEAKPTPHRTFVTRGQI